MTPAHIKAARKAANLTQAQAAEIAGLSARQRWIEYEKGDFKPSPQTWELFLLRTGQHPTHVLTGKSVKPAA